MRLIGYSIIVAMVLVIIASLSSAVPVTSSVGGVAATSASGAGYGDADGVFITDTDIPIVKADVFIWGVVPAGSTGSFAASYDTQGAKSKTLGTLATDGYSLKTTVNGKVAVNIVKTSTDGFGNAGARLYAESGVVPGSLAYGEAEIGANATLTGAGTVSASATGTEVSYDTWLDEGAIGGIVRNAPGYVKGTATVNGQNTQGDYIDGSAEIASQGAAAEFGTEAFVKEMLFSEAKKGISFDGISRITATVDGEEFAEPISNVDNNNPLFVSDIEAVSKLSGLASVYKRNDWATSHAAFIAASSANGPGYLKMPPCYGGNKKKGAIWAEEQMFTLAQAGRLVSDPDPAKAVRSLSKVESADWSSSAAQQFGNDLNSGNPFVGGGSGLRVFEASVSGKTGFTENGNSILLPGIASGAAATNAQTTPPTAIVNHAQIAEVRGSLPCGYLEEDAKISLFGPMYSGTDTGGAGAYLGVVNQNLFSTEPDPRSGPLSVTKIKNIADQNAIYWTNGALWTPDGHKSFSKPMDTIIPFDTGLASEQGPILWSWQASGASGALLLYRTATFPTLSVI